jgi:uncharacterized membrane protein YfcA
METAGYIAAGIIGLALGMTGGGGSILTVPVLVYLFGIDAVLATTYSLFIVGVTSLAGGIRAYANKLVDFKAVTEFGIPSILSVFIMRHFVLPAIPSHLFSIGNISVTKDVFLMLVFAVLMLTASFLMIRNSRESGGHNAEKDRHEKIFPLALLGLLIGAITGLLGAGGGFLIIPALVLLIKLSMKTAVGTSLMIIAINSLFGFLFSLKQFEYDWKLLISFTVIAIAGILAGNKLAEKISADALKKGFGWLVLLMAVYIIIKELFLKQ